MQLAILTCINRSLIMTYEEWTKTAKCEENIQVSREVSRAVYKFPNRMRFYEDTCLPHNIFRNSSTHVVVFDYIVKVGSKEELKIVQKYNGYVNTDHYTDEGYGVPAFSSTKISDPMKAAWDWSKSVRKDGME